jgi:hypothetical protein
MPTNEPGAVAQRVAAPHVANDQQGDGIERAVPPA